VQIEVKQYYLKFNLCGVLWSASQWIGIELLCSWIVQEFMAHGVHCMDLRWGVQC